MSDDFKDPRDPKKKWPVPDWLMGAAEALAAEQGTAAKHMEAQVIPAVPRRRYIYRSCELTRVSPRVFRCRVTLYSAAGEFSGEAEGPDVPGGRAEIAARATLDALNKAEDDFVALALKGARVLRVFDGPIVVVGVFGMNTGATPLVGACLVEDSVEQAATLAALQAADRWLAWEAKKRSK
jgi:hypothetical protein